jgi:hypothetical protein
MTMSPSEVSILSLGRSSWACSAKERSKINRVNWPLILIVSSLIVRPTKVRENNDLEYSYF